MKKTLLLILLVTSFGFLIVPAAKSQNAAFPQGANVLNIGVGMWGTYHHRGGYYGDYRRSYYIPNISVSLDHGLKSAGPGTLALGGIFAVRGSYYKQIIHPGTQPVYYDNQRWTDFFLGARLTYHLGINGNDKFDFYPGLSLGFVISKYSRSYPLVRQDGTPPYKWYVYDEYRGTSSAVYPAAGLFLGFRYNFTQQVGIFTEFGWEFTAFKIGLAIKF